MSLAVIVTRSQPGAGETAQHLKAAGFTPILSPMLSIVETGFDPAAADGLRHIIFTSINGVHAVRGADLPKDICAWCVGPSTAKAARDAGFGQVLEGDGNANDLAALIIESLPIGPLLHVANEEAAGTLVATLRAAGFDARFTSPYRTEAAPALSAEALDALAGPGPALLLVHSAKAAAAVAASAPDLNRAALVAISAPACAPLENRAGLGNWTAHQPNESALLDALREARAKLAG